VHSLGNGVVLEDLATGCPYSFILCE